MKKTALFLLFFILFSFLTYLLSVDDINKREIKISDFSYIEKAKIIQREGADIKWSANVKRIEFPGNEKTAKLDTVDATFPKDGYSLVSDKGEYDIVSGKILLHGNVKATGDKYTFYTDRLDWNIRENTMKTDSVVTISGKGMFIRGDTFKSHREGRLTLEGNVKAVIM